MKEDLLLVFDRGIWRVLVSQDGQPGWELYSSMVLEEVLQNAQDRCNGAPVGIPLLSRLMS